MDSLKQAESAGLGVVISTLQANETTVLADIASAVNNVAVGDFQTDVVPKLPVIVRTIVNTAINADRTAFEAAFASGEKAIYDFIISALQKEQASLST